MRVGREASPLRKLFVILVLLGIAFVGGVLASGSKPAWLQTALKHIRPRRAETNLPLTGTDVGSGVAGDVGSGIPAAPVPPLLDEATRGSIVSTGEGVKLQPAVEGAPSKFAGEQAVSRSPSLQPTAEAVVDLSEDRKLFLERQAGNSSKERSAKKMPGGWDDAPNSAPAVAALPGRSNERKKADAQVSLSAGTADVQGTISSASTKETASPSPTWSELKSRMVQLGVSRYWLEGDAQGHVYFRCVVPITDRGAVGEIFEAEGEEVLGTVDAALRRIVVWRATESSQVERVKP